MKGANPLDESGARRPDLFRKPLTDLGQILGPESGGIYSPLYEEGDIQRFMTPHYSTIESAREQARTIDMHGFYRDGITEALRRIGFDGSPADPLMILEIGAGFGSATLPTLGLFPNACVYATELSLPMLTVLKERLESCGKAGRCVLLQLNAEALDFVPASFDLVVGGAILHHLFDPGKAIGECAALLKPGGVAVFFEPFENGMSVVKLIYKMALRSPRSWLLSGKTRAYMRNAVDYWQKMTGTDKQSAFDGADDKWLFPRQYLLDHARENGFADCLIYPVDKSARPFESLIKTHLRGNGISEPPKWFWNIVDDFEDSFSFETKQDLLTEGVLVLKK